MKVSYLVFSCSSIGVPGIRTAMHHSLALQSLGLVLEKEETSGL